MNESVTGAKYSVRNTVHKGNIFAGWHIITRLNMMIILKYIETPTHYVVQLELT